MTDYFALFNLPASLDIDLAVLTVRYQQLQQLTHPDKFASASAQEQRLAVQKNAQINDAMQTLKHPLSRATHLLALRGFELHDESHTLSDTAFLMQQMEWRESLAELSEDEAELTNMAAAMDAEINTRLKQLSLMFDDNSALPLIADEIKKLTFVYKFADQIEQHIDALDD